MIYLVRHGQTEFNREQRLQGHVDSPLTELGLRQAGAVAALLKDLTAGQPGWRVVSSPLGRARGRPPRWWPPPWARRSRRTAGWSSSPGATGTAGCAAT
ncbi:histidine phosphatase family protein [Phenylobacterium sp. J367]|uniref:histidine phosphatase family protein n=1 Tax=Phenylobacterium sp. J367 TaxID=2898435 RepID=UPI002151639A|nr:histidine phosphatase family protein [Phenylobacterium sp. J367]MCR5878557.1 histidine phosphatase family protein [Phenylobacterium sp. J367]